jgi:hypothetical protein
MEPLVLVLTAKADSTILTSSIYELRVSATSGIVSHSRLVDVLVPGNPDFALGASLLNSGRTQGIQARLPLV